MIIHDDFIPFEGMAGSWSYRVIGNGVPVLNGQYYLLEGTRLAKKATHDMRGNYLVVEPYKVKK